MFERNRSYRLEKPKVKKITKLQKVVITTFFLNWLAVELGIVQRPRRTPHMGNLYIPSLSCLPMLDKCVV